MEGRHYSTHMTYSGGVPKVGKEQHGSGRFRFYRSSNRRLFGRGSATTDIDRSVVAIGAKISTLFCPTRRPPEAIQYNDGYALPNPNPNKGKPVWHARMTMLLAVKTLEAVLMIMEFWTYYSHGLFL